MRGEFELLLIGFGLGVGSAMLLIGILIRFVIVDGEKHKKSCREHSE